MKARLFGLLCLIVAALAAWWGIWEPLRAAAAQETRVRYSLGVFVLVSAGAVFGLFFLIFGNSVPYRHTERQSPTRAGWALFALTAAAAAASFWWFKNEMTGHGYGWSGAAPQAPATLAPLPGGVPPRVEQPDFGNRR